MVFVLSAEDVHVSVETREISSFMSARSRDVMCFRCGEYGHVRYQCLRYKVTLCRHWTNGNCALQGSCVYAHGEAELRTPWKTRCVRVVKQDGELVCIGCNSTDHTFRKCPLNKDVLIL